MIEKFSDFESTKWIDKEGKFTFTVKEYELKESSTGNPMAVFTVVSPEGQSIIRHSLNPKARFSYNGLIKACLKLDTPEKIATFELDYETIGQQLKDKKFIGVVKKDIYQKEVAVLNDDGTMGRGTEDKESYKIVSYEICK